MSSAHPGRSDQPRTQPLPRVPLPAPRPGAGAAAPRSSAFGPVTGVGGSTRRIVVAGMSTLTVLVLLFGYHTSTEGSGAAVLSGPAPAAAAATPGTAVTATTPAKSGRTTTGTAGAGGSTPAPTVSTPRTVTGPVVGTRWGPVQVAVTVTGGRITNVEVLQHPSGNGHDEQVNARAVPVLVRETLAAQSSTIDMVSGATITSTGYRTSLQSALDQLHG